MIKDEYKDRISHENIIYLFRKYLPFSCCTCCVSQKINDKGLADRFEVDSAGIGNWHVGQLPDSRMRRQGERRGYMINHKARQFQTSDFKLFDRIVVMDNDNYRIIVSKASNDEEAQKVVRMADFFTSHPRATSVPDPYYGGPEDFDLALDLIEDGVEGLLKDMMKA